LGLSLEHAVHFKNFLVILSAQLLAQISILQPLGPEHTLYSPDGFSAEDEILASLSRFFDNSKQFKAYEVIKNGVSVPSVTAPEGLIGATDRNNTRVLRESACRVSAHSGQATTVRASTLIRQTSGIPCAGNQVSFSVLNSTCVDSDFANVEWHYSTNRNFWTHLGTSQGSMSFNLPNVPLIYVRGKVTCGDGLYFSDINEIVIDDCIDPCVGSIYLTQAETGRSHIEMERISDNEYQIKLEARFSSTSSRELPLIHSVTDVLGRSLPYSFNRFSGFLMMNNHERTKIIVVRAELAGIIETKVMLR